jgi:hypothetical protein
MVEYSYYAIELSQEIQLTISKTFNNSTSVMALTTTKNCYWTVV